MQSFWLLGGLLATPFLSFIIDSFLYKKKNIFWTEFLGLSGVFIPFMLSCVLFVRFYLGEQLGIDLELLSWISIEGVNINFAISYNPLSALMCLVITGVGLLVHIFSIEYMKNKKIFHRYFAYLNLFIFNMLLLVLGKNLLVTFIAWEGMGFCLYLLINYGCQSGEKTFARMRVFVINRIGDAGFLIGMVLLYLNFGTLDYEVINKFASNLGDLGWMSVSTAAVLAIFIGVAAKSSQLPLSLWLQNRTINSIPVSALIYTVAMAVPGIYVLFRLNGLLSVSPQGMSVIAFVGILTAFIAAVVALTEQDIKKILACSAVSQLGYMVFAIGVGSYVGAVFHLVTHTFFKVLMFLGAGVVVHSLSGEQNIEKMGGLKKSMPITYFTFLIGWFLSIGTSFFSGFFGKNEIFFHTVFKSIFFWTLALMTMGVTVFYMIKLMVKVFEGESRVEKNIYSNELKFLFVLPLVILAICSVFFGFLGLPQRILNIFSKNSAHLLEQWLSLMIRNVYDVNKSLTLEWLLILLFIVTMAVCSVFAYFLYVEKESRVRGWFSYIERFFVSRVFKRLVYTKGFYKNSVMHFFKEFSKALWLFIDVNLISGFFISTSRAVMSVGKISKTIESKNLEFYVMVFILTIAVFLMGALFI